MRLNAQAKLGFYPAPPRAINLLASRLRVVHPCAVLDPCAGQGAAIAQLATLLGIAEEHIFAIELEDARAEILRAALPSAKVLAPANFLGCAATPQSFPLAYCNAPFDDHFGGGRVEADFLRQTTRWLMPGGVLVLCCPERVAESWEIRSELQQWYTQVTVLPFEQEYRQYGEVFVLAVRRREPVEHWRVEWDQLQAPAGFIYTVPGGTGPKRFEKVELTDRELTRALAASPLRKLLAAPPEFRLPSPPLALETGHLALLLASGQIDGLVCPKGESPHVVRGTARKVEYLASESAEEDERGNVKTIKVFSEKIQLVVRVVDANGDMQTLAS